MDRNQFIGRSELLVWINRLLNLRLERIEECCNGVVYLQLMDLLYPGKVPLSKIKWNSSLEYEHLHNYKILQNVFRVCNIPKDINVERLIKGRYQDNLEFLQWMKSFVDKNCDFNTKYDPLYHRVYSLLKTCPKTNCNTVAYVKNALPKWAHVQDMTSDYILNINNSFTKLRKINSNDTIATVRNNKLEMEAPSASGDSSVNTQATATPAQSSHSSLPDVQKDHPGNNVNELKTNSGRIPGSISEVKKVTVARHDVVSKKDGEVNSTTNDKSLDDLRTEIELLNKKIKDLQMEKQVAKMSKDFYYNKLRQIEILCQNGTGKSIKVQTLLEIMYNKDK